MFLRYNQREKVEKLTKLSFEILDEKMDSNKIFFSAPTGSGKTFMLSNVCWNLINKYEKIVIFFVSLSSGQIEKQNYDSYVKYKNTSAEIIKDHYCCYLKNENNFLSSSVKDFKNIHNFSDEDKQIYFLGTQQFTKSTILFKENILRNALENFKNKDYKIVYIRDEAHISKKSINNKLDSENLNNLFQEFSDCSIFCSATMTLSNDKLVIFDEQEAIDDCLIKENLKMLHNIENDSITSEELTEKCIENFINIKKIYKDHFDGSLNPALLIQIPSKSNKHSDFRERSLIKYLISKLKENNLYFVIWCDDFYDDIENTNVPELYDKKNKDIRNFITENSSIVDVIIFKVALATGWNIPRANTLLQLRELHSDELNIQTIGRIRRNPLDNLDWIKNEKYNFCNDYFIYTNNLDSKIKLKNISLKEQFYDIHIKHVRAFDNDSIVNWDQLKKDINEFLDEFTNKYEFEKNSSSNYRIQKINKLSINVNANQYFLLSEFYKIFNNKLNRNLFLFFKKTIDSWVEKNHFMPYKHKIYKKIIENENNIIKIINNNISISIKYNMIDKHALPKNTQVELVLKKGKINEKNSIGTKRVYNINKFNKNININGFTLENKWAYNEFVTISNNLNNVDAVDINAIQLDSNGEYECCSSIFKWINNNDMNFNNTVFFTKHYLSSSMIKYPYIHTKENELKRIYNTYPDFMLVLNKEGRSFYIIIEVKSKKYDYDKGKTKSIREMFKNISQKNDFKNYYFCLYLYDGDEKSSSYIEVFTCEKMECYKFDSINDLLNCIVR